MVFGCALSKILGTTIEMTKLKYFHQNANFAVRSIENEMSGALSMELMGKGYGILCKNHRMAAVSGFALAVDVPGWRAHLEASAQARLNCLKLPEQRKEEPGYYQRASYIAPFCDALAIGREDLATEIVGQTPREIREDDEFLEDFHYAWLLYDLLIQDDDLNEALMRFETALCGTLPARLDVVKALVAEVEDDFRTALMGWVDERTTYFEERQRRYACEREDDPSERIVAVEGLALLRLGTLRGLRVPQDMVCLPNLLRLDR